MRSFRHKRGRILFEIFGAFLLASLAAGRGVTYHSTRSLIVGGVIALYALYRTVMLFARNPALGFGGNGVQVGQLFKVHDFRWNQVREIQEVHWKRPSIPYLNWLPKERHYLELKIQSAGLDSGSIKIRSDMIELPARGVKQIIEDFRAAQVASLGERGAAMARLGAREGGNSAAPASALQAERWQRLGLGAEDVSDDASAESVVPAPGPHPGVPPRPVFGRKVS